MPGDVGPITSLQDVETLTLGQRISADKQYRRLRRSYRKTQAEAIQQQSAETKNVNPDLIAVFVARQNTDLRDVSTRYYGTPHEWQRIAKFNHQTGSTLSPGQVVLVPRLRQQATFTQGPSLQPTPPKAIETGVVSA
jgi:nucleoid-associated protein YgaU